jgi:hypothetical protein
MTIRYTNINTLEQTTLGEIETIETAGATMSGYRRYNGVLKLVFSVDLNVITVEIFN